MNQNWIAKKSLVGITVVGLMGVAIALRAQSSFGKESLRVSQSAPSVGIAVRPGAAAPAFTGTDSNGKTHRLSDFKGKAVVLEWTNHQCPFVRKHYDSGNMQQLQKEATGKGVVWLSVVSSGVGQQGYVTGDRANELTKSRNAAPTAVILDPDGKIGGLYQARTTPHVYVIGQDGAIKYMGAIDSIPSTQPSDVKKANNYVRAAVDDVLKGKQVSTPVTQPYGCSVKYKS